MFLQVHAEEPAIHYSCHVDRSADETSIVYSVLLQVHAEEPAGDVLIFMTGQDEIEALERLLQAHVASQLTLPGASNPDQQQQLQLMVVSIFSAMPPEQQLKVSCSGPSLAGICVCCPTP